MFIRLRNSTLGFNSVWNSRSTSLPELSSRSELNFSGVNLKYWSIVTGLMTVVFMEGLKPNFKLKHLSKTLKPQNILTRSLLCCKDKLRSLKNKLFEFKLMPKMPIYALIIADNAKDFSLLFVKRE